MSVLALAGLALVAAGLVMAVTAALSRRLGRVSVVDVAWGLGFVAVAATCALLGTGPHRWLLLGLVGVWGLRLSWHIGRRQHGGGEDPRYEKLLDGGGFGVAVRKVFATQAVALWFVSLPVVVAAAYDEPLGWLAAVGGLLWLVGVVFESVGDAQLASYRRDPDRGPVLDRGLWAWTRHPNYFGDACVWWGIWLVALDAALVPGLLTVLSPAVMTYFLVFATGARLLEQTMMQRPGYPEYAERTPMFLPRPPRR